jgi:hypothetical protein
MRERLRPLPPRLNRMSARAQLVLAACVAATAVAATMMGASRSWAPLGASSHLTRTEAANAAAVHEHLPVALFDRLRARLRPGDRWWLEVPAGAPDAFSNRGSVYRAYAVFWFLPALPAGSRSDATIVFRIAKPR